MSWIIIMALTALIAVLAVPVQMAALTANVERSKFVDQGLRSFAVAASTTIYKGALVGLNASGYLVPYTPSALFVGVAYEESLNGSGSNGDTNCRVETAGDFVFRIDPTFVAADVGKSVYATTDNDLSLSPASGSLVGHAVGLHASGYAVVRIEPQLTQNGQLIAASCEVDCQSGETPDEVALVPASMNNFGLALLHAAAIVTEVFAGASQDQGIVALQDSDGTALNITFTPADAGADLVNDFIQEAGSADTLVNATSGDAGCVVAAGKGVKAKVTQATSGAGAAGKLKIVAVFVIV